MRSQRALAATCAALLPALAAAQPVSGPYVSLGAGVDFLQNEITVPQRGSVEIPRSYRFDPGPAGAVAAGYGFANGFRAEIEGDYANSHVRGVAVYAPERAGGYEQQYGGFLNGFYDFDLGLPASPYVGVGLGYQEVELDGVSSGGAGFRPANLVQSEGAFAYQAIAGLSLPIDLVPGLSLTAEYRFIGVDDPPPYSRTSSSNPATITRDRVAFTNIFNHEILLGVRYAFYTPPPPAPPSPAPAPPQAEAARTYLVFFDWDKAALTGRARQIVAQAAAASTQVQTTRIEVNGYTDTSGTPGYNQALSVRRADAVAAELVRDGVPKAGISIRGYGETRLLVQTGPGVREPQNRRVEIILR